MTTSWLKWFGVGFAAVLTATACEFSSGDGDDDDDTGEPGDAGESGRAGRGGSGGRSGAGTGGTSGRAGSGGTGGVTTAGTAGTSGSGGEGGDVYDIICETDVPAGTPADTCEFDEAVLDSPAIAPIRACIVCLSNSCCDDMKNCYGVAATTRNVCGWGGPIKGQTEYLCFRDCMEERTRDGGGVYDDMIDVAECGAECSSTAEDGGTCDAVGLDTQDLIGCMLDNCDDPCIIDPAMD